MSKTPAASLDSAKEVRRSIPSIDRLLSSAGVASLVETFGRERVKSGLTRTLQSVRDRRASFDHDACISETAELLQRETAATLRPVINGSGVIIHTNLGRSPIGDRIWQEAAAISTGYSNLEFDLEEGERGARDEHLTALCQSLFGCEAALLVNNNAAGTLLVLAAIAAGKEVIVSRGELVEIGGAFRVPDVIEQGGARLREVGTTNRTRTRDYEQAISRRTAALLRVHRSNFDIVGFTEQPSISELVAIARKGKRPLIYDEGSGRVVDLSPYGFSRSETIAELIAADVDVVTCSTDKLIGATQGGLLLGRAEIIDRCRRHPLMRALRVGKESYAVIAATLRSFVTGRHEEDIPIYTMLRTPIEELRARAERIIAGSGATIISSRAVLGGGTTPNETIESMAIAPPGEATMLAEKFRRNEPPIIGRVLDEQFAIDVRTLLEKDDPIVRAALG